MRGVWTLALLIACDGGVMTSEDAGGEDAGDAEIPMDTSNTDSDVRADSGGSDAGPGVDASEDSGGIDPSMNIEGFGAVSVGGVGGDTCTVTTLDDSGDGSLRDCIDSREGSGESVTPRTIEFAVGGTITLQSDIVIDEPYLTIDGATAPSPGITITKINTEDGELVIAGRRTGLHPHDLIIRYLRFDGVWEGGEAHSQNSATITIDGENNPEGVYRVVLDHIVCVRASDGSPDMWGNVRDVTLSWSLLHHSLHPTTISWSGSEAVRERISMHHNVYAHNHERNPQVRGTVRQLDIVNSVIFEWKLFGGGYGIRLRERNGVVPDGVNLVGNFFSSVDEPGNAVLLEPTDYPGNLFMQGNVGVDESIATTATAAEVPVEARVTTFAATELDTRMLPFVGLPERTPEEQATFDAIAEAIAAARE